MFCNTDYLREQTEFLPPDNSTNERLYEYSIQFFAEFYSQSWSNMKIGLANALRYGLQAATEEKAMAFPKSFGSQWIKFFNLV